MANGFCIYTRFIKFFFDFDHLFSGLTRANFEANSADFTQLAQNFRNFKQKPCKYSITVPKSSKIITNIGQLGQNLDLTQHIGKYLLVIVEKSQHVVEFKAKWSTLCPRTVYVPLKVLLRT